MSRVAFCIPRFFFGCVASFPMRFLHTTNMTRPCEATGGGGASAQSIPEKYPLANCHIFIGKSLHMAIFNRCVELPEGTWYNSGHARRDDTGMMRSAGNHPRPYEKNYFTVSELL